MQQNLSENVAEVSNDAVRPDQILELILPEPDELRARTVVSRSKARGTGKYPSWKNGRMLEWESPHELNAFRLLDVDPSVTRFNEQPLVIKYLQDDEERLHVPDIKVVRGARKELWEVKTLRDAQDEKVVRRTHLMTAGLRTYGYTYRVVIAEDPAAKPRMNNALTVLKFGRAEIPLVDRERLRRTLTNCGCLTWGAVVAGDLGPRGRQYICRLILEGGLQFDMDRCLNSTTAISVLPLAASRDPAPGAPAATPGESGESCELAMSGEEV
ncbi:hypothetical protein [Roseateles violae]|uniref:TnsA endonuclease-like protein n=1 Tax=Roseateles violae TaxID=3058042 RepID=A0ABT8DW79_9BURK|nr:hypothetical protein [Pelomonas sp. PFR6]MDN3922556.1 hypothetical protein [Pelomonas sp. PFR6]